MGLSFRVVVWLRRSRLTARGLENSVAATETLPLANSYHRRVAMREPPERGNDNDDLRQRLRSSDVGRGRCGRLRRAFETFAEIIVVENGHGAVAPPMTPPRALLAIIDQAPLALASGPFHGRMTCDLSH
jgi:hypothetical protein